MELDLPPLASLSGDEVHLDRVELDPVSYTANRLTPAERKQFEDEGVGRLSLITISIAAWRRW